MILPLFWSATPPSQLAKNTKYRLKNRITKKKQMFCEFNFCNGLQDYNLKSRGNLISNPVWSNGAFLKFWTRSVIEPQVRVPTFAKLLSWMYHAIPSPQCHRRAQRFALGISSDHQFLKWSCSMSSSSVSSDTGAKKRGVGNLTRTPPTETVSDPPHLGTFCPLFPLLHFSYRSP